MAHKHAEEVEGCFGCKIRTIHFGTVPGGARSAGHDTEAFESQFGDMREIEEYSLDATEGYGPLRWSKGEAYHQDKNGDYQKMTANDFDKIMYGSKAKEDIDE